MDCIRFYSFYYKQMTHSKNKGKRGELEVVELLEKYGFSARRGQQFKGTPDSPDIIHNMEGFHIEVKKVEAFHLHHALEQAIEDKAENETPLVFYKKNRKPWIVVLEAEDFLSLMQDLYE